MHVSAMVGIRMLRMLRNRIPLNWFTKSCLYEFSYSLEIPYVFIVRETSSYVDRIRNQQKLKESNRIPDDCYEKGEFIFFTKKPKKVLVNKVESSDGRTIILHRQSFKVVTDLGLNAKNDSTFLNVDSNTKCQFAVEVSNSDDLADRIVNSCGGKFIGIRSSLFLLPKTDSAITSQGVTQLSWQRKNVYCSNCGSLLINDGTSITKVCNSESCLNSKEGNRHHPPINPVGICLVSNKSQTKALLARSSNHPPGMYTCIAGFIEVGETIEENIRREVAEEVGKEVLSIEYVASQHWAFPSSRLMIGCHATVEDGDENISIDSNELEDAAWFTPKQIKDSIKRVDKMSLSGKGASSLFNTEDSSSSFLWVPPRGALANTLIKLWLKKFHPDK